MLKKTATIVAAAALVMAIAVFAIGQTGQATACDGKTKTASSTTSSCTKTASAAKVSSASTGTSSCSKAAQASCSKSASAKASCCPSMAKQAHYTQVKEAANVLPYRENSRVVLAGTYKCGSCDLSVTDKCQAFLKTANGQLYPLDMNATAKAMYKSSSKEFEVTGRVIKMGGTKYLDVTNYSAM